MAVLLYQIGIFMAIQIASLFGKSARNTAIILITIFTLLQVFMSWLLLLQLITIFISYKVSKRWFENSENESSNKKPNNVLYSYRENGGHSVTEVDLNNETVDAEIRRKAKLQEEARKVAKYSYENDPEMKSAVDEVLNSFAMRAKGIHPSQTNGINLKTKFYYIDHSQTYGPITTEKLIRLVKNNQINRNCFVCQKSEKGFEKRAYEIVELFR